MKNGEKAIDSLDETAMDECLHNDYKFTLHSAGKTLTKVDVIDWVKSGDIKRDRVRILYENDEIGVEHAFCFLPRWKYTSRIGIFNIQGWKNLYS